METVTKTQTVWDSAWKMRPDSCVEEIKTYLGNWWVGIDASSIDGELTFNSGQLTSHRDSVEGPFESEKEATDWLRDYDLRD